jgi:hypothetical protein
VFWAKKNARVVALVKKGLAQKISEVENRSYGFYGWPTEHISIPWEIKDLHSNFRTTPSRRARALRGQPNRLPPFRRVPALEEIDVDMKPLLPYPDVARNAQGTPPLLRSRRPRLLPRFSRAPRPGFPPILHGISLLLVAKFLNLICGADVVAKDQPFSIAAYISSGPVCDSPSVVQIVRSLFVVVRCGAVRMESGFRLDLCAPC